ncbi:MAG: YncE family protein [Balneolales bacterium]
MNLLQNKYIHALIIIGLTGLTACSDDPVSDMQGDEAISILIANEGNFADGNGSITNFDSESGRAAQAQFENENGRPLAGIIQSTVLNDSKLFIVANNSDKIEVTHAETLESVATINFDDGLTPSGFAVANDKGYVSSFYESSVAVVDLENNTVTETRISVGNSPREMLVSGNNLYVANSGNNTVTVIDTETNNVTTTLEVGAGPSKLIQDDEGRIWVVCSGIKAYDDEWQRDPENDTEGGVAILNTTSPGLAATIETGGFPNSLTLNEQTGRGWVVNEDAVQEIDMNSYAVTEEQFIDRSFNGIGYSMAEDLLYMAHSRGYSQAGQAIMYNLNGTAIDSFQTGIAPHKFIFLAE